MTKVVAITDDGNHFFSDHTDEILAVELKKAGLAANPDEKEAILLAAIEQWPRALDTYIALYKFYFRTAQYQQAEAQVWKTLFEASRQGGFNRNYRRLTRSSANWLDDKSIARLYLFSLKALGVIRLRRGKIPQAKNVLTKLLELDPYDEIGGSNFLAIAESFDDN